MVTVRGANLWWWRQQTIAAADARAANLAYLLAEYVRESFAAGDAVLQQLAVNSQRIGGPTAPDADWAPLLASSRAGLAGVGSMTVTDERGTIVHSTVRRIVGQSRSDDYVVRTLSTSNRDELVIDTPFLSISEPRQYLIPIGRRLSGRDGRFVGAVVATFLPAQLHAMLRAADVGSRGQVTLVHPSGVVLIREPERPAPPRPITQQQTAAGLPVTVVIALDRSEVLAAWRAEAFASLFVLVVVAGVATPVFAFVFRQMDAKQRAETALREVEAREARDVREARDRLAEALAREQQARRDVEAASRMKDEFLMTVSHELRTPLTSIHGWAEMLVGGALKPDRQAAALASILRNARTQSRLVEDLLDTSRIITGALRLDLKPVDLDAVVRAAIDAVQPSADAKRQRLDVRIDRDVPRVLGDPARLQQVVWNVLSNAIKFTPDEGRIEVRVERRDADAEIAVRDSGVGIAPDFLPYVFERFRRADSGTARRFSGLGLGLAIARHLVELHGGSIVAESDGVDAGATFRIRLGPLVRHPAESATQEPASLRS